MDIKNIFKISPTAFINTKSRLLSEQKNLKTDDTTDRDGNGQTPYQKKRTYPALTEEEQTLALNRLKLLPPLIEHKWRIKILTQFPLPLKLELQDNLGQLIKTIDEEELRTLLDYPTSQRGHLIKRTA